MTPELKKIFDEVRHEVAEICTGLKFDVEEALLNKHRGAIEGLLMAAKILTGDEWDWESDGIYRNHGNEPYIKW